MGMTTQEWFKARKSLPRGGPAALLVDRLFDYCVDPIRTNKKLNIVEREEETARDHHRTQEIKKKIIHSCLS